jgi:hypothetical protein
MHLAMCGLCDGFAKQIRFLRMAARRNGQRLADGQTDSDVKLSPEARARIEAALRDSTS